MKKTGTVRRILKYFKKNIVLVVFSIILSAVTSVSALYIPVIVGNIIDLLLGKNAVDFEAVISCLLKIGVIAGATAVLQWIMNTVNNRIVYELLRDVRNEAFEKLEKLPLKYIDSHSHGEIVSRVISDADQFADGLLMGLAAFFTGIVTIVATLVFMLTIHPIIALIVVVLTPISLFTAKYISEHTYSMFKEQSETRGEQTAFVEETVSNQKIVKAFNYEEKSLEKFDLINEKLEKCSLKATFYSSLTNPTTRFINSIIYAGVVISGAFFVIGGGITVGGLSCFLSYANQYTKPFNEISATITELQNSLACATRLFELIDEKPITPDLTNAIDLENTDGNVDFDNVSFSYSEKKKLIENLTLSVKQGQRVAIVGPTGCGKTTLINLLMRFYDVDKGSVSVDGTDIRLIKRKSLRSSFGMVLQDTWIKKGTIRENIAFARPDADIDEIIEAAKAAHAHSFIKRLPNKYDFEVSENGGNLSEGQRQLLSIARVMLCLPPMLILDEATSSIDTRTELRIQKAFNKMMQGRTSFIVAHRLSTIREADVILVMDKGKIVEQGNHETLLAKNGFYAKLYNSQFNVF